MVTGIQYEVLVFLKEIMYLKLDMMGNVWLTQENVLIPIKITILELVVPRDVILLKILVMMMTDLVEMLQVVMVNILVLDQEGLELLIMDHVEEVAMDILTGMVVMTRDLENNLVDKAMKMMIPKMIPCYG